MNITYKTAIILIITAYLHIGLSNKLICCNTADTLQAHYSVSQCDSLIQANSCNPDFIILDVRTPREYLPQHINGAININYYAADFSQLLDALPKHKFYLVHCASGGRSNNAFNTMLGLNFSKVVNMLGGMGAWNSASLTSTSNFAPLLMAVSDTIIPRDSTTMYTTETITLTITNRGNDTLKFNGISSLLGSEFSSDFDTTTTLLGAEDYSFSISYSPVDNISDSIDFLIESNGGNTVFDIWRTGILTSDINTKLAENTMQIFPNPASSKIIADVSQFLPGAIISIFDIKGRVVLKHITPNNTKSVEIDVSTLPQGLYLLRVNSQTGVVSTEKFLIAR